MKKLSYLIILVLIASGVQLNAQIEATGTPIANYSIYKNKLKKSDENLTNEKKSSSAKFWLSRAELLMDIFDLNRDHLQQGTSMLHVKLMYGDTPLQVENWEEEGIPYEKTAEPH